MPSRDPALQAFLASVTEAIRASPLDGAGLAAIDRISDALGTPCAAARPVPQRLPACTVLPAALSIARAGPAPAARVADGFAAIEPTLTWRPRASGGPGASDNWLEGHANTTIVGPGGLEPRHDVVIGASLLAPRVRYPDHTHPPEEVYLVLSPGRFRHGASGWFEPGLGGTLYNEPGIRHAMASDDAPLLAVWCLWTGEPARGH